MTDLPLLQLWQYGTVTCRITPATEAAPYCVVVTDGREPPHQRTFATHNEAISYAIEELRRATPPNSPQ
jgi:hypothetical protein